MKKTLYKTTRMVAKRLALPVQADSMEGGGRREHERSESRRRRGETLTEVRSTTSTNRGRRVSPSEIRGYTLVEVLVVAGIAALLAALMLANPGSGNRTSDVQRAAQILSLDLRRAQAFAVSAREEATCTGNVVPYYGIRTHEDAGTEGTYELFADCDRDNRFDSDDVVLEEVTLKNVAITENAPSLSNGNLEVVYAPPNPDVTIRRQESNTTFSIELCHLDGPSVCRTVGGNNKGNVEITE